MLCIGVMKLIMTVFVKWHHDQSKRGGYTLCPNIVNRIMHQPELAVPTLVPYSHHREHRFDLIIFLRLELITKAKGSVSCTPHHHELH